MRKLWSKWWDIYSKVESCRNFPSERRGMTTSVVGWTRPPTPLNNFTPSNTELTPTILYESVLSPFSPNFGWGIDVEEGMGQEERQCVVRIGWFITTDWREMFKWWKCCLLCIWFTFWLFEMKNFPHLSGISFCNFGLMHKLIALLFKGSLAWHTSLGQMCYIIEIA